MAYEITEAKELVIAAGKELLRTGLIARTWGNISARISDSQFVITPSGLAYDSLTPDDLVVVTIADCSYEGTVKPSSEKGVHAAAYRERPDVNFVIHTHQDYATTLSAMGKNFDVASIFPESAITLGPIVPTAKYGLSSTKMLTNNVAACIRKYPDSKCVLMQNHGTVCMGWDETDAFDIAHVLENLCKEIFVQLGGGTPPEDTTENYRLADYSRVYRREIHEEYDAYYEIFARKEVNCVIETRAPYVMQMSEFGKGMKAYVDDLAQIVGLQISCLPYDTSPASVAKALSGACDAVFIKGRGAVCTGGNVEDAEAVVMVLDKGCQAALLAKSGNKLYPVSTVGGMLEHVVYTSKYAKLKK